MRTNARYVTLTRQTPVRDFPILWKTAQNVSALTDSAQRPFAKTTPIIAVGTIH